MTEAKLVAVTGDVAAEEQVMATQNFPEHYQRLEQQIAKLGGALPGAMGGFSALHKHAVADGAIGGKTKELIALAIAIAIRCEGCIAYHVHDALKAGANRQEIVETIGVTVMMGGGPAVVYGSEALVALEQFESGGAP